MSTNNSSSRPPSTSKVKSPPLRSRDVSQFDSLPEINLEARMAAELAEEYKNQCLKAENLLGQQYVAEHIQQLNNWLEDPHAETPDFPFEIIYIEEDRFISVIPVDNNLIKTPELAEQLNVELKIKLSELVGYFADQENRQDLEQSIMNTLRSIVELEHRLAEYLPEKPQVSLVASAITLDTARLEEDDFIPGLTPPSMHKKQYIYSSEEKPAPKFMWIFEQNLITFNEPE